MEPTRSFSGTDRASPYSDHSENESRVIEQPFACPLDYWDFNKVLQFIEVPKIHPCKCLGPDSNQSGNTASLALPCIPKPQKRSRRTLFSPPTLLDDRNNNQKAYHPPTLAGFSSDPSADGNNTSAQKPSSTKRRPLYLPLPRRMSCKFAGDPNQVNLQKRPIWNYSSKLDNRSRSVSGTSLSPVRSLRPTSISSKSMALEHFKSQSTPWKRESVFDRLYREGSRRKNSMQVETVECPVPNYRPHGLLSTPQAFSRTTPFDAHGIVTSPVQLSRSVGIPSSSLHRSHIEWSATSPLSRSLSAMVATTSVFYPPKVQRRRKGGAEKASDAIDKAQKPSVYSEASKTWENIATKLGQLYHKGEMNESLNELIMQLIEEQPSTPIDTFVGENVISWESLISLLAEETQTSTNVTHVEGLNEKLLPDCKCKWLYQKGSFAKTTEVRCSTKPVHQNLPYKEFESAVIFDPMYANAILREHDTYYSSSPNLTTVVDQAIDFDCQEDSSPFGTQPTPPSSTYKINANRINLLFKGDNHGKEILASTSSPRCAEVSSSKLISEHEPKQAQDDNSKSNCIDSLESQNMVSNATLMRSCLEVIEPYGENGRLMEFADLTVISPLSNDSSTEQMSESREQDSLINGSLASLNSASEHLIQEGVELLKTDKAQSNVPVTKGEIEKAHEKSLQNQASSQECFDQLRAHKPLHQRKKVIPEFPKSKEKVHQNNCVGQAVLDKPTFAYLCTDLENETEEVCKVERILKFSEADCALQVPNEQKKQSKRASNSSSFMAADAKLIAVPESGTTEFSQSSLLSLPLRANLSAPRRCYKVFQGMNEFPNAITPTVSFPIGSQSSRKGLLILPYCGPCKHQRATTPHYLFRRATPEETAKDVAHFREVLSNLNSRFRNAGITTKVVARELKQSYREIILAIRSRLSPGKLIICQNSTRALGATLVQCVENFVRIVDEQVMHHKWLEAWDRGCLLRLKADFIRYLYEAFPANLAYQLKCREAYKSARLFFLENGLQDKAEWVYLQMNYATFLHVLGERSTAQFINERLIHSLAFRRCGKDIKAKLQLNLQFYSKPSQ